MSDKQRVGFIGIGMLGKPMSRRILKAGYPLTVYDIRPEPVEELVKEGAGKAASPKEVAELSDVVLTSLPKLEACEEVYLGSKGLLKGASAGQFLVETSTVPPSQIKRFAKAAAEKGVSLIDASLMAADSVHAPGTAVENAAKGQIMTFVGGSPEEVEKVRPVLETFANPIYHMGPLGYGALTKVLLNAMIHANYTQTCEVLAVAAKAGADISKFYKVANESAARSMMLDSCILTYLQSGKGRKMPTFIALKDSQAMLEVARELGVPVLMHSLSHAYHERAQNSGLKDQPWDEMLRLWEEVIGKPIRFT